MARKRRADSTMMTVIINIISIPHDREVSGGTFDDT